MPSDSQSPASPALRLRARNYGLAEHRVRSRPPVFTLFGEVVNGMMDGRAGELLRSVAGAGDVTFGYGSVSSASAGLEAVTWEASDDGIMCIRALPEK